MNNKVTGVLIFIACLLACVIGEIFKVPDAQGFGILAFLVLLFWSWDDK